MLNPDDEYFQDVDEVDYGFEPELEIDEDAIGSIPESKTLETLKEQAKEDVKAEPEATADAPTEGAEVTEEEPFEQEDATNWSEKVTNELKDALDLFGIKPTQVSKREDYEFVQDQMAFVRDAIERDPEFAEIQAAMQMDPEVIVATFINNKYGDEDDEEELTIRMSRYIDPETNELNAKGKALAANQLKALEQRASEKIEGFKAQSKTYASQQHQFYSELNEKVKTFQPKGLKIKVGQEEIEINEVPKVPVAQKRILKSFLETDYLAVARADTIPQQGKSKAEVLAENAFWINPVLRETYMAEFAAKVWEQAQSHFAGKNIFK